VAGRKHHPIILFHLPKMLSVGKSFTVFIGATHTYIDMPCQSHAKAVLPTLFCELSKFTWTKSKVHRSKKSKENPKTIT